MHFKKTNHFGVAILIIGFVMACGTALYIPKESASISKEELKDLQEGRALYISKCGSCHTLFLPEQFNNVQWKMQVERMAVKANLTSEEEEAILKYVTKNDSTLFKEPIKQAENR
jgi:mono/diheme cytochrome c family protein